MNDEKKVNINFPKKMEVHSPEIDSINKVSQRISNWLHHDMLEIVRPLQVLNKIPELFKDIKIKIVEQFSSLSMNIIEMEVVKKYSNLKSLEKKIKLMDKSIDESSRLIEESVYEIDDRIKNLMDNYSTEHEKYLKELDKEAYSLIGETFDSCVLDLKKDKPKLNFVKMSQHLVESSTNRGLILKEKLDTAQDHIESFIERRRDFHSQFPRVGQTNLVEGDYGIGFYYVKIKNKKNNSITTKILLDICNKDKNINLEDVYNLAEMKIASDDNNNSKIKDIEEKYKNYTTKISLLDKYFKVNN